MQLIISMLGKMITFLICCIPLKRYLRVIACPGSMTEIERIRRVETISWNCLLVSVVCNSIWTSYAFKVQCIEIAIVNVFCKSQIFMVICFRTFGQHCAFGDLSNSKAGVIAYNTVFRSNSNMSTLQLRHVQWLAMRDPRYNSFGYPKFNSTEPDTKRN